jgi:predicted lactoylglutathione lyase
LDPRLSFVTLGVANVGKSRKFYEALGLRASAASQEEVAFFDLGGIVLSLFGGEALAKDAGVPVSGPGFSGIALAHNVNGEVEVDQLLAEAVRAGARLVKPGQKAFWGGYSGYFADPDGHLWEVAYNPFMPLDANGRVTLPASTP